MAEIARELGLSRMTVSSVLNNQAEKRRISGETGRRVREYMSSRGYVPHRYALELKQGKTGAVGILHSGNLYSHLTEAYNRMCDFFSESPRRLELMVMPRDNITEGVKELIARCVSSLVWIHTSGSEAEFQDPAVKTYLSHVTPIIYNYRFSSEKETAELIEKGYYLIGVDRKAGYSKLAGLLGKLGHRTVLSPEGRLDFMLEAFGAAGMKVLPFPARPAPGGRFEEIGRNAARASLPYIKKHGVTAVCFGDDLVAGYALSEFNKMRIHVPKDLTVTGFDGLDIVSAFHPHLTTLRMPAAEMVDCAGKIISGKNHKQKNVFTMELLEGGSHSKARKQHVNL